MGQPVTIYEVAREAGVSISTVSNALNRPDRVSEETRARVLRVADELGYVPKADAVTAARRQMRRIGVVAPFTAYHSYMQRLVGIMGEAADRGFEVSVFDHESAATAATPVLAALPIRGQLDGLIVMGTRIEDEIELRLRTRALPTVVIDAYSDLFSVITCDDAQGGRLAASHLHDLGHRRFGYVLEHQVAAYESQAVRRLAGFRRELDERGGCDLHVLESGASESSAREAAQRMLSEPDRPTAVMAHYDELAVGVLHAARGLGLSVPHDLSIMGCDDGPIAMGADLTTVRQPFKESGAAAARVLLEQISHPSSPRTVSYLDLSVVERGTTAAI